MLGRVFISYSETDYERVRAIVEEVERNGLETWFAPNKLSGGTSLSAIADQIGEADYFVVALSRASGNSRWVRKEIDIAVSVELAADRKSLQIVPVLIDRVVPPTILADKVFVDLTAPNREAGLRELVSILKGESVQRETGLFRFQGYIRNLIPLPEGACDRIRNLDVFRRTRMLGKSGGVRTSAWQRYGWSRGRVLQRRIVIENALREVSASSKYSSRILDEYGSGRYLTPIFPHDNDDEISSTVRHDWELLLRARSTIEKTLIKARLPKADITRILAAYDEGGVLPIITVTEKEKLSAWVRHADEELVTLLSELWRALTDNRQVCVDMEWMISFIRDSSTSDEAEWTAEQLVTRAKAAGLLARSTDEELFEFGPMVFVGGTIAADFQVAEEQRE